MIECFKEIINNFNWDLIIGIFIGVIICKVAELIDKLHNVVEEKK